MRKCVRLVSLFFSVIMLTFLSSFTAFAAENHYFIEQLHLNIDLPEEMLAITRESPETNKYFSVFGLDYESTMSEFENNNIYLQGMYEDSSKILTITMVSDENSRNIGNYNALSDDQLIDVEDSFLSEQEYSSCTIQLYNDYVFMELQFKTEADGKTVYATQCNTVVDGNNITLTLQPSNGNELTNEDYQIMSEILQSVEFSDRNTQTVFRIVEEPVFWYCVIAGVAVLAVVIIVIFVVKRNKSLKKSQNTEKKIKNQQLLQELAQEFSSNPVAGDSNYDEESNNIEDSDSTNGETAEEIIKQFRNSEDFHNIQPKKHYAEAEAEESEEINRAVSAEKQEEHSERSLNDQQEINSPLNASENPVLKIVTPEDEQEEIQADEYDSYAGDDYDEEEQYDDEVIGSAESFQQGEDYFDEAPDEEVYSRSNIDDEDEYERKRALNTSVNAGNAKAKAKTAGAVVLNGVLIFLNGVKSFFIHLGYFFTNLTRLIKRAYKKRKYQKAEMEKRRKQEEAQRRRQENLRRKQQKQSVKDANGLVKVHSRTAENPNRASSSNNSKTAVKR